MKDTITKTVFINAPRETVWDYLVNKDKLALWFHEGSVNLEQGKPYNLLNEAGDPLLGGDVLEADPPKRLVYTLSHEMLNWAVTTVTWELSEAYGGTKIHLTHSGFDGANDPLDMLTNHDAGWDGHFGRLRTIVTSS